jgi:hypothetical protein
VIRRGITGPSSAALIGFGLDAIVEGVVGCGDRLAVHRPAPEAREKTTLRISIPRHPERPDFRNIGPDKIEPWRSRIPCEALRRPPWPRREHDE